MKCKHCVSLLKCEICIGNLLIPKKSCYSSVYIPPLECSPTGATGSIIGVTGSFFSGTQAHLITTFTLDQLTPGTATSIICKKIPITGSLLRLAPCKSPYGWGLGTGRDSIAGTYSYIQVPKCCSGCYTFTLSASITITGNAAGFTITLPLGLPDITLGIPSESSLPLVFDLSLCQVDQKTQCAGRTITLSPKEIIHVPDAPCSTGTYPAASVLTLTGLTITLPLPPPLDISITLPFPSFSLPPGVFPVTATTSGIICIKENTQLVPCITIRSIQIQQILSLLGISVNLISGPFNLRLSCLSLTLKKMKESDYMSCCDTYNNYDTGNDCDYRNCYTCR